MYIDGPIKLNEDNSGAIFMAKNGKYFAKTRNLIMKRKAQFKCQRS